MDRLASAKIDKTAFSVDSLRDPSDEKAYWLSKTPQERLEALELMRQIVYGYDPATTRLQRVFEAHPVFAYFLVRWGLCPPPPGIYRVGPVA
jgi:hypothetical protein